MEQKNAELTPEELAKVAGGLGEYVGCPKCGLIYNPYSKGCGRCNPDLYRCPVCNESFYTNDLLVIHRRETGHTASTDTGLIINF